MVWFLGAWVLVACPMYQGAVEMSGVNAVRSAIRSRANAIAHLERVSLWLLPPVAYVMTNRKENAWRQQVMASLTQDQRAEFLSYSNKGAGRQRGGSPVLLDPSHPPLLDAGQQVLLVTRGQDRKIPGHILAWRHPSRRHVLPAAPEAPRNGRRHLPSPGDHILPQPPSRATRAHS